MKVEELLNNIQIYQRSYYADNFSEKDTSEVIEYFNNNLIKSKRLKILSSYNDIPGFEKKNIVIIVKNTYKILEEANNGAYFDTFIKKGVPILFFLKGELKNEIIKKQWINFLTKANLHEFSLNTPTPQKKSKIHRLIHFFNKRNIAFVIFSMIFLILISVSKKFLPLLLSILLFFILVTLYYYAYYKTFKGNRRWMRIVFLFGGLDSIFGLSIYDFVKYIYNFIKNLI